MKAIQKIIPNSEYRGYTFKCFELNVQCYDYDEINEDVIL
jgi:hypothetical protein